VGQSATPPLRHKEGGQERRRIRNTAGRGANVSFCHFSGFYLAFAPITSLLTDDNSLRIAQNAIFIFVFAFF
jgi:hypothetical protein